jgi:hypothetical protein
VLSIPPSSIMCTPPYAAHCHLYDSLYTIACARLCIYYLHPHPDNTSEVGLRHFMTSDYVHINLWTIKERSVHRLNSDERNCSRVCDYAASSAIPATGFCFLYDRKPSCWIGATRGETFVRFINTRCVYVIMFINTRCVSWKAVTI